MPVMKVADSLGHTMDLYMTESKPCFMYQEANPEFVEKLTEYPLRGDDVVLCSYAKSGCHWVWEIGRMLLGGHSKCDSASKEDSMLDFNLMPDHDGSVIDIDKAPSPRILNSHLFSDVLPSGILKGNKVIFLYRNPKDVAVSLFYHCLRLPGYNYTAKNFASFLVRFVEGLVESNCVFDYLCDWESVIDSNPQMNVCVLSYEDLQDQPLKEVRRLAEFLGKDYKDDFLQSVIEATSIDAMRATKCKDDDHTIIYRKGKVGDWKNHFTVAQSEWFDHMIKTRMRGSKMYKFRYEL